MTIALPDPRLPDRLTGLTSRRRFLTEAAVLLGDPGAAPLALIFADIDHCAWFNGCHGPAAGDALIVEMARCCEAAARPGDLLARVAGDKFAILMRQTDTQAALVRAETLRKAAPHPILDTFQGPKRVGLSIGVAAATDANIETLLAAAQEAAYEAKRAGRNRVQLAERR